MSDMLSHWAIFEDCRRIAAHDAAFEPELSDVIARHLEYARLGTVSRGGNKWMQPIMERAKARWSDPAAHPALDRELAFALGGLPHQAIDNVIKPYREDVAVRDEARPEPLDNPHRWLYAYQDAFLFRRVFGAGEPDDGFLNRHLLLDNQGSLEQAIEAYARSLVLRALQGLHTLAPDVDNMETWIHGVTRAIQPVTVDITRLVEAFVRPDPDKLGRFHIDEEFYREADPAIELAENVRRGEAPPQGEIDGATDVEANRSIYGRALAVGIRYMREGARFWRGDTDRLDTPNYDTSSFWTREATKGRRRKQEVTAAK